MLTLLTAVRGLKKLISAQDGVDSNKKSIADLQSAITAMSASFNATIAALNKTMVANMAVFQTLNATLSSGIASAVAASSKNAVQIGINAGTAGVNHASILGLSSQILANQNHISKCCNKSVAASQKAFRTL